jgi:hypothetical protein
MSEEDAPDTVEPETSGEVDANNGGNGWERLRHWLRMVYAVLLAVLLVGDIALYSLYQAEHSRVNSLDHRIERMDHMLMDLLAAQGNAEKIEKIEQQVTGMQGRMDDLATVLKEEDAAEEPPAEPEKKKR